GGLCCRRLQGHSFAPQLVADILAGAEERRDGAEAVARVYRERVAWRLVSPSNGANPRQRSVPPLHIPFDSPEQMDASVRVIGRHSVAWPHFREKSPDLCLPHAPTAWLRRRKSSVEQVCEKVIVGVRRDWTGLPPANCDVRICSEIIDEGCILAGTNEPCSRVLRHRFEDYAC